MKLVIFALQSFLVVASPAMKHTAVHPSNVAGTSAWHPPTYPRHDTVTASYVAGGDHGGDKYNDSAMIGNNHKRIGKINMWCDKDNKGELQALSFDYRDNFAGKAFVFTPGPIHGTNRNPAWLHSWTLDLDEYVKFMTIYVYKAKGHSRVGTIIITTNKRTDLAFCGPQTGNKITWGAEGEALSYIEGSSGRVVDYMKGNFISAGGF